MEFQVYGFTPVPQSQIPALPASNPIHPPNFPGRPGHGLCRILQDIPCASQEAANARAGELRKALEDAHRSLRAAERQASSLQAALEECEAELQASVLQDPRGCQRLAIKGVSEGEKHAAISSETWYGSHMLQELEDEPCRRSPSIRHNLLSCAGFISPLPTSSTSLMECLLQTHV